MALLFSIIKVLSGIAIFQSLLITFYILTNKKGTKSRKYLLTILLLTFTVFVSGTVILLYFSKSFNGQHIGHLLNLSIFLTAPLLYFYYKSYSSNGYVFEKKDLLHFVPFTIIFIVLVYKMGIQGSVNFVFEPYGIFLISFLSIQNIFYLSVISSNYKSESSANQTNKKYDWFKFVLISFITLFSVKLIIFIIWNILEENLVCIYFTNIFFVLSFLIINTLVLLGLHNPEYLIGHVKYQSTKIDDEQKEKYLKALEKIKTNEEIYLDPLINLNKISKILNIPPKHLSQIINETHNLNFNDYINRLRIDKAIKLFDQDQEKEKNILEIAYEVGFSSKTTFNTAFKKHTGKTPSEYRK